jgi:hypothetical protein
VRELRRTITAQISRKRPYFDARRYTFLSRFILALLPSSLIVSNIFLGTAFAMSPLNGHGIVMSFELQAAAVSSSHIVGHIV